jgi:hypothetical protein
MRERKYATVDPVNQLPRGRCRACGCTDLSPCPDGCGWSDRTLTHCTACFCAACGRKFLTSNDYLYEDGVRVCRAAKRCARTAVMGAVQAAAQPLEEMA